MMKNKSKQLNIIGGIRPEEISVVLTPKDTAEILQVTESQVIKLINNGELKVINKIRAKRISSHSLFRFIVGDEMEDFFSESVKEETNRIGLV